MRNSLLTEDIPRKHSEMVSRGWNNPPPSCGEVVTKALIEILGFIVLILPMAYIYVFTKQYEPYHR